MPVVFRCVKPLKVLILAALSTPAVCYGYGAKAHRLAGHIAESRLCDTAAQKFAEILPDMSLAEAGLWADQIRSDRDWDFARPWHYINVPDDTPIAAAERSPDGDVLGAIEDLTAQLSDGRVAGLERETALLMLVHFVVDIHQPLHVGRKSDLGGNRIQVRLDPFRGNLHAYWDTQVFAALDSTAAQAAELLSAADPRLFAQAGEGSPLVWATESQDLRARVYDFDRDARGRAILSPEYQAMARAISQERLVQAGLRLADLLNGMWCRPFRGS